MAEPPRNTHFIGPRNTSMGYHQRPGHVYLQSISVDKLMSQLVTINKESEPQDGGGGGPAAAEMAR